MDKAANLLSAKKNTYKEMPHLLIPKGTRATKFKYAFLLIHVKHREETGVCLKTNLLGL